MNIRDHGLNEVLQVSYRVYGETGEKRSLGEKRTVITMTTLLMDTTTLTPTDRISPFYLEPLLFNISALITKEAANTVTAQHWDSSETHTHIFCYL